MDEIGREVLESARRPCDREVPPPVGDDDPFEVTVTVDPDPQVDLERHALPQDPVATIVVTNTSDEVLYHHRSHALTLQDPDTNAIVSHGGGAVPADLPRGTEVPPGATSTERVSLALTACLEPGVDATTIGDPVTPGTYLAVGAVRVSPDPWGQGAITRSTPPVRVDID